LESVINSQDYWKDVPFMAELITYQKRLFRVHWTIHSTGPNDLIISWERAYPKTNDPFQKKKNRCPLPPFACA
jgi:hypothetical protein